MKLYYDNQKLNKICLDYGISYLALFGSYARGEEKSGSDLDLLVKYSKDSKVRSLFDHLDVEYSLENLFDLDVDLVTERSLHPYLRSYIQRDIKVLYER